MKWIIILYDGCFYFSDSYNLILKRELAKEERKELQKAKITKKTHSLPKHHGGPCSITLITIGENITLLRRFPNIITAQTFYDDAFFNKRINCVPSSLEGRQTLEKQKKALEGLRNTLKQELEK